MAPWACPSCGARAVERRGHALLCTFCGSSVRPKLEVGTLCGDVWGERHCSRLAVSLCDGCGIPLCDRHNDPKTLYWTEPIQPKALCPGWDPRDLWEWAREIDFRLEVPVPGFDPCPVRPRREEALRAAGAAEESLREEVRGIARELRGEAVDSGCLFSDHCSACVEEARGVVEEAVSAHREALFAAAIVGVLDGLLAETEEALRYVEAFPGATLGGQASHEGPWDAEYPLAADGPPEVWGRYWDRLKARQEALQRLRKRAGEGPRGALGPGRPLQK